MKDEPHKSVSPLEKKGVHDEGVDDKSVQNSENRVLPADTFDGRRLVKQGGWVGVKGAGRLALVASLFAIPNLVLLGVSIQRLIATGFTPIKLIGLLLVLALGAGATYFAIHRNIQYILIEGVRVIYENLSFLFRKVSVRIIDKVMGVFENKDVSDSKIGRAFDVGKIVNSEFQKTPKFLRYGITMVLNRTPLASMLMDLHDEISAGNKEEASSRLYEKMDRFIKETIFESSGTGWVWALLPLNIVISTLLIIFMIG